MEERRNAPKLRFPGFTDPWEQRRLGEVASFNPQADLPNEFEYVDLESVVGTEMVSHRKESKLTAPSRAQRLARKGDIFYQTVRPYQKNNLLFELPDENYVFSTGYAQIRTEQDSRFLFCLLQREPFVRLVLDRCTGTSYPAISATDLETIDINLPSMSVEQARIGSLFQKLDSLIALHQRELDHVKELKKGLLQKMFPKEGANVPELRFPGFTDPWEQRRLGELCSFAKGRGYSKIDIRDSGVPLILYGRLYTQYQTKIEEVDTFTVEKDGSLLSKGNEVIVPASGETAEDIAVASSVRGPGIIFGGDLNVLTPGDALDPDYVALGITYGSAHSNLAKRAQGKSVVHVHNADIAMTELAYPSIDEQRAISILVLKLDSLIALHQRELDHVKELKKGLLQQMFV